MKKMFLSFLFNIFYFQVSGQVTDNINVSIVLPSISLVDIEPDNSAITMAIPAPSEAGLLNQSIELINAKRINYSSSVAPGNSRSIMVQLSSGNIPSGTKLSITASNTSNGGAGAIGTSPGTVEVSALPQALLLNIGGAYTSNGNNKGHKLDYKLEVIDVSQLDFDDSNDVGLTFTIMDN